MNIIGFEQINIARIVDVNVINIFTEDSADGKQKDLSFVQLEIVFEFNKRATLSNEITHMEVYLNKRINRDALDKYVDVLVRREKDFPSYASYINYLNNLKGGWDKINEILDAERYNLFNWEFVGRVDPKSYISDGEIHDFATDLTLSSLVTANTKSPRPQVTSRFKPKNKLTIRQKPAAVALGGKNSNGTKVKERVNTTITIPRSNDMRAAKERLANHSNLPFSELFRENKHEKVIDTLFGNIDTQHPPNNPDLPIVRTIADEQAFEAVAVPIEVIVEPEEIITAKVKILVADEQITGEVFQVKCIICSANPFTPFQLLLENIETELIRASRIDLARPRVKLVMQQNADGAPRQGVVRINVNIDRNIEGANLPGTSIDWIKGFTFKRRKFTAPGQAPELWTTIGTSMLASQGPHPEGIETGLWDNNVPIDGNRYEYRVTPLNRFGEEGIRFGDAITPPRPLPHPIGSGGNFNRNSNSRLNSDFSITAEQESDRLAINIIVRNIHIEATSVNILRRNLSLNGRIQKIIKTIRNEENFEGQVQASDEDINVAHTYEYEAQQLDAFNNSVRTANVAVVELRATTETIDHNTQITNVRRSNKSDPETAPSIPRRSNKFDVTAPTVSFDISTGFEASTSNEKIAGLIQESFGGPPYEDGDGAIYADKLKSEIFQRNVGRTAIHRVTRTNLTTGEIEASALVAGNKFDDNTMYPNAPPLNHDKYEYSYSVKTTIVDVKNLFDALEDPTKANVLDKKLENLNGTIRAQNTNNPSIIEEALNNAEIPGAKSVSIPRRVISANVINLTSTRNRNKITLKWDVETNSHVDFYQIERGCSGLARESLGTTEGTIFRDKIDLPELANSDILYTVTPIMGNGTLGGAASIRIKHSVEASTFTRAS